MSSEVKADLGSKQILPPRMLFLARTQLGAIKSLSSCVQGEERKDHTAAQKGDLVKCPAKDWFECSGRGKQFSLESNFQT